MFTRQRVSAVVLFVLVLLLVCSAPLGAQQFLISPPGGDPSLDPDVAFGAGQFFVTWTQTNSIYGTRVLPDGTVLDADAVKLPEYTTVIPGPDMKSAVSFNGVHYVVTYESSILDMMCIGSRMTALILVARVSQEGTVLDATASAIDSACTAVGGVATPDIASDGYNSLVPWIRGGIFTGSSVKGSIITPDLAMTFVQILPSLEMNEFAYDPSIAYGGSLYLVVWTDTRDGVGVPARVYGARVTPSGGVLDPTSIPITSVGSPGDGLTSVVFGSSIFMVVWQREGVVRAARVTLDGQVLDPDGFVVHEGSDAAVSYDGSSFLVVWTGAAPDSAVHGTRIWPDGAMGSSFLISNEGTTGTKASVAFDGERYLVVWEQEAEIYGAFVDREPCRDIDADGYGNPADPSCTYPELDCDDSNPLVNPGVQENCSNGIDDNCNGLIDAADPACQAPPWSGAAPAQALEYRTASLEGSDFANCLSILLPPIGMVLLLRVFHRKRA